MNHILNYYCLLLFLICRVYNRPILPWNWRIRNISPWCCFSENEWLAKIICYSDNTPLSGFAALTAPRGSVLDSFIVFGPGLSVINPSTTIISLSSVVWGTNCVIQPLIRRIVLKIIKSEILHNLLKIKTKCYWRYCSSKNRQFVSLEQLSLFFKINWINVLSSKNVIDRECPVWMSNSVRLKVSAYF